MNEKLNKSILSGDEQQPDYVNVDLNKSDEVYLREQEELCLGQQQQQQRHEEDEEDEEDEEEDDDYYTRLDTIMEEDGDNECNTAQTTTANNLNSNPNDIIISPPIPVVRKTLLLNNDRFMAGNNHLPPITTASQAALLQPGNGAKSVDDEFNLVYRRHHQTQADCLSTSNITNHDRDDQSLSITPLTASTNITQDQALIFSEKDRVNSNQASLSKLNNELILNSINDLSQMSNLLSEDQITTADSSSSSLPQDEQQQQHQDVDDNKKKRLLNQESSNNNNAANANSNKPQIPSTNRLLIEHQAREKQALFKAIYQRQKIIDELGAERPADLLSASSWRQITTLSRNAKLGVHSARNHQRKHHHRHGDHHHHHRHHKKESSSSITLKFSDSQENPSNDDVDETKAIPLSSVDLSSMSDRMLDNLLGHLAPASSVSSLSSHGESLSTTGSCCSSDDLSSSACSGTDDDISGSCNDSDGDNKNTKNDRGAKKDSLTGGSSSVRRSSLSRRRSLSSDRSGAQHIQSMASDSSDLDCCSNQARHNVSSRSQRERLQHHHHHHHHSHHHRSSSSSKRHLDWLPNIVGVHEDEQSLIIGHSQQNRLLAAAGVPSNQISSSSKQVGRGPTLNCRENSGKFNKDNYDDEDDPFDRRDRAEQLSVHVCDDSASGNNGNYSSIVLSGPTSSEQLSFSPDSVNEGPSTLRRRNINEVSNESHTIWTNRLNSIAVVGSGNTNNGDTLNSTNTSTEINDLETINDQTTSQHQQAPSPSATSASVRNIQRTVERVLEGMLDSINKVDVHEYERLDELLENGFVQLEYLMQCPSNQGLSSSSPITNSVNHSPSAFKMGQGGAGAGVLLSNVSLLSKDSDYGSDTNQSGADCFSHLTTSYSSKSTSAASTANRSQSDSPLSGANNNDNQQQSKQPVAPLSGLAVDLMFKLHESLRNISQQRAVSRHQQQQQQQMTRQGQQLETSNSRDLDAPRRSSQNDSSVVQINASPGSQGADENPIASFKNHNDQNANARSSPTKNCFKTRIEIASGGHVSIINQQGEISSGYSNTLGPGERSRPGRSSIRRRPSFSGSLGGGQRAGSPVPRSILEPNKQAPSPDGVTMAAKQNKNMPSSIWANQSNQALNDGNARSLTGEQQEPSNQATAATSKMNNTTANNHQRQLQRALVYAQKYDFSPAKLASSKLGSKLQIGNVNNSPDQLAKTDLDHSNAANNDNNNHRPVQQQVDLGGALKISGQVQLDISYLAATGQLIVHLIQCNQLAAVNRRRQTSNPYIKIYLLPDRSKAGKRKTNVVKAQLNPYFNQSFSFGPIQLEEFNTKQLWLSVVHQGSLSRSQFLGGVLLPLAQVRRQLLSSNLTNSTGPQWYPLQSNKLSARTDHNSANEDQQQRRASSAANGTAQSSIQNATISDQQDSQSMGSAGTGHSGSLHNQAGGTTHLASGSTNQNSHLITGQLFVSLKFVPSADQPGSSATLGSASRTLNRKQQLLEGDLHVMIKQAQGIGGFDGQTQGFNKQAPSGALPNPVAKCCLLSATNQRLGKEKTPQLKRTSNPRWDHTCIFKNLKLDQLAQQTLEISIYSSGDSILVSNNYLGSVRLSCPAQMISSASSLTASASFSSASSSNAGGGATADSASGTGTTLAAAADGNSNSISSFQTSSSMANSLINQNAALNDWPASDQEREWRLWSTMLAKPKIWSYAELNLRDFRQQQHHQQ